MTTWRSRNRIQHAFKEQIVYSCMRCMLGYFVEFGDNGGVYGGRGAIIDFTGTGAKPRFAFLVGPSVFFGAPFGSAQALPVLFIPWSDVVQFKFHASPSIHSLQQDAYPFLAQSI